WVDELADQPGAGHPVHFDALARNPFHAVLLSTHTVRHGFARAVTTAPAVLSVIAAAQAIPGATNARRHLRISDRLTAADGRHQGQNVRGRVGQEVDGAIYVKKGRATRMQTPEMELVTVVTQHARLEGRGPVRR